MDLEKFMHCSKKEFKVSLRFDFLNAARWHFTINIDENLVYTAKIKI